MAIILEFNLICRRFIDLERVLQNPKIHKLEITMEKISTIDDWTWTNQKKMQDLFSISKSLEEAKIAVINLKSNYFKDAGIYIEKINEEYVYNLWINTEGYPDLDADEINSRNKHYFQKFYQIFEEVEGQLNIEFRILGIGLETNFQYEKENSDVIKKSQNIIAWVVYKDYLNDMDFINYRKSHEAYLILLKRELLCQNFLFLGCSFEDDILRICIKDILNCIENSEENYVSEHYAIIVEEKAEKLEYISKDLSIHYSIKCLTVQNVNQAYKIAYGISCKVKYGSVFVSGAKKYERHSDEENYGKIVCQNIVNAFMQFKDFPFKFISGMGMSIGHFICGTIKQNCKEKNLNLNRYLQMEPFPFTSKNDNDKHRENIINKAVHIFVCIW